MPDLRLVVFDIDGTLVDSAALIVEAFAQAFAAVGRPAPARGEVLAQVGLSLPQMVERLLPDAGAEERDRIAQGYRDHYVALRTEQGAAGARLFDGAKETIEALAARPEVLIGAATGMAMRGLLHVLEAHDLGRHFITRQSADGNPSKPHPAMLEAALREVGVGPERAVMVGDTSYDMEMAAGAGVAGIGVSWGYHSAQDITRAGASRIIDSFAELPGALDDIWRQV